MNVEEGDLAHEQAVDVGQPAVVDELLGRLVGDRGRIRVRGKSWARVGVRIRGQGQGQG